ncbi:hypothetical protein HDU67_005435 [Dinochytrium kinnereticum]|nr:hypothetical protein HDU67_005435 [Dinochytrium kinnereticum]
MLQLLDLLRNNRKYCLDLAPKLLFSSGVMVQTLIRSKVGQYLEFKVIEKVFLLWNKTLEVVPGKKEDVFSSESIGLADKRRLMKLLTQVQQEGGLENGGDAKYLEQTGLEEKLQAAIKYAIAFLDSEDASIASVNRGFSLIKRYMESLGRYGDTAFLSGIYGTGSELSQAFCRYCAVYGGEYRLNMKIETVDISPSESDPEYSIRVGADGDNIFYGKVLISSQDYLHVVNPAASKEFLTNTTKHVLAPKANVCWTHFNARSLNIVDILSFVCVTEDDAVYKEFDKVISELLEISGQEAPQIALKAFYKEHTLKPQNSPQSNIIFCRDDLESMFCEDIVNRSEQIFSKIDPDHVFLPPLEAEEE